MHTLQDLRTAVAKGLEEQQAQIVADVLTILVFSHRKWGPSAGCHCYACKATRIYVDAKRRGAREQFTLCDGRYVVINHGQDPEKIQKLRREAQEARENLSFLELPNIVLPERPDCRRVMELVSR